MDPGHNSNTASLSRRQLQPVLSQSFLANAFIEANDEYWPDEFGGDSHYWAYDREHREWHKCVACYGYGNQRR